MAEDFLIQGKVKFYIEKKGYGFVVDGQNGREYFFHINSVVDKVILNKDDEVFFSLKETKRGVQAVNVYKKR